MVVLILNEINNIRKYKMNVQTEYLVLQCPNCLGKLENVSSDLVVEVNEGYIFVGSGTGDERLECVSCGTVLQRKQTVQPYNNPQNVTVKSRGVYVGGNVRGSIITGNGNVVQSVSADDSSQVSNIRQNVNKWW
jgi:hypothetical protein